MANIRLDLGRAVTNGETLTFRSPVDCSEITGLKVCYPNGNTTTSEVFEFADAHGNNVGSIDLFASDVLVKVILDTELNRAYVQNADTNAYLEGRFASLKKANAGFIYPLASATIPDGFLLCDGAAYKRTEYPELFAAIGTIYGAGDGETTFNVPNLSTRVPVGVGDDYYLGATGGEAEHTLTIDEIPQHRHSIYNEFGRLRFGVTYGADKGQPDGDKAYNLVNSTEVAEGDRLMAANVGNDKPHNNMQPYTVVNYIISTGKDTAVSVQDIVLGAQAIPLGVQYGGTGATSAHDACKNINALHAVESTEHPGCYYRMVDGEKEWINPPMLFDVEYRTAERNNGNVLYTKTFGVYITGADTFVCKLPKVIRRFHAWTSIDAIIPNSHPQEAWRTNYYVANNELRVTAGSSIVEAGDVSAWFQLWYCK